MYENRSLAETKMFALKKNYKDSLYQSLFQEVLKMLEHRQEEWINLNGDYIA